MSSTKSRKNLTFSQKLEILKEGGKSSQRAVAAKFGVSLGVVNRMIKRKLELETLAENNCNHAAKRVKNSINEDLNEQVWEWFVAARSKNIPVSGPILQEKALNIATELGQTDFKASNGWLEKFRLRYNINFKVLSGESAGVDQDVVKTWKQRLDSLIDEYSADDIFNCDETGLFYKALPTKSLVQKGDSSHGSKIPKNRLTILLCSNMSGTEKLIPLMIGKSKKPRCFKNIKDVSKLPVTWKHNKKAWMNTIMFDEWLKDLNRSMAKKKRNILLFVDNAPSNPQIKLSNVVIKFFPGNCTSELQPMDQGIIKKLKTGYRKRLLLRVIAKIDSCETGDELVKSVNVLDAIYWVAQAWEDVTQETIQKCYARSGFEFLEGFESFETSESTDQLNSLLKDLATITETESCTTEEYVNIDSGNQVHTLESTDWEAKLHSCINDQDITPDENTQDLPEP